MNRNVVLIVLDSVRKDVFDRYATRLRRRADVSFEQCRAASSWSTPSHASMFTGRLPHQHGFHTYRRSFADLSRDETFLGRLDGYRTIGISSNLYTGPTYGFDELFDEYVDIGPRIRYPDSWIDSPLGEVGDFPELLRQAIRSDAPAEYLLNALSCVLGPPFEALPVPALYDNGAVPTSRMARRTAAASDEPFFMFLNFMDVHQPLSTHLGIDDSLHAVPDSWSSKDGFYRTKWDINARNRTGEHREFLSNYRDLYGATVEYLDRKVSALVDAVRRVTDRPTTFVVTADHGENLGYEGDGYQFEHTNSLSEGLLHVPLCVIDPPGNADGSVDSYVSQVRMGELIAGLASGETPDVTDDRIAAEVMGLSPGTSALSETERRELDRTIRCAYRADTKVLWDSDGEAVRYRIDPGAASTQEVIAEEVEVPAWARDLFDEDIDTARRVAMEADGSDEPTVDARTQNRLEDLGYL